MSTPIPPVTGKDWQAWARQLRAYLQRGLTVLQRKDTNSRASENGILMWDEVNGYPVVSIGGQFEEIVLGNSALDFGVRLAESEILSTYGDTVSVLEKKKTLLKFGRNDALGTSQETVWTQTGHETYATTNAIDTLSSSNAGDAQTVTIEGHTVSGTGASSQFTFVTQQATVNGQTKVVLSTPLARVSRMFINTGGAAFAGDVYIYEDTTISTGVPTTSAPIHMKVAAGDSQSFKLATTFSNTDYAICTGGFVSVDKKTAASVDFEFQVRQPGNVFLPVSRIALNSAAQSTQQVSFYPYVILPKNADFRVVGTSSASNTAVSGSVQFFLASVQ